MNDSQENSVVEIRQANKSIEEDLKAFGLENINASKLVESDCEWHRHATELCISDLKVDVFKLQSDHKQLTADILKSQDSIKALKECLATKVNESEISEVSAKRNAFVQMLESKQKEIDIHLLSVIKKIEDLG